MASGLSKRAPRRARSDSRDWGGTRARDAIPPIVSKSRLIQHWAVRSVIHMISTVFDIATDTVGLLKILRSARRFPASEQISYFFWNICFYQNISSWRIDE